MLIYAVDLLLLLDLGSSGLLFDDMAVSVGLVYSAAVVTGPVCRLLTGDVQVEDAGQWWTVVLSSSTYLPQAMAMMPPRRPRGSPEK